MEKKVRVNLGNNPEANEIARFVQVANQFTSTVHIELEDSHRVNVKSIMGMMSFLSGDGQEVVIRAEGADEEKAVEAIAACLAGKE